MAAAEGLAAAVELLVVVVVPGVKEALLLFWWSHWLHPAGQGCAAVVGEVDEAVLMAGGGAAAAGAPALAGHPVQ